MECVTLHKYIFFLQMISRTEKIPLNYIKKNSIDKIYLPQIIILFRLELVKPVKL